MSTTVIGNSFTPVSQDFASAPEAATLNSTASGSYTRAEGKVQQISLMTGTPFNSTVTHSLKNGKRFEPIKGGGEHPRIGRLSAMNQ